VRGERGVERESICWTASLCAEREEGKVANELGGLRIGVVVEDGIVGLERGFSGQLYGFIGLFM
jgi:hypothetical protein